MSIEEKIINFIYEKALSSIKVEDESLLRNLKINITEAVKKMSSEEKLKWFDFIK